MIVNLIANTRTDKGFNVECSIDHDKYEKGIKISKEHILKLNITPHEFHGEWNYTIKDVVENTMSYLEEYHQRSNSESGFAADKKMPGWNVAQKREDKIDNALFCTGLWHNLFNTSRY